MTTRAPTLQEVIQGAIVAELIYQAGGMPARIVKFDAAKQMVNVKPLINRPYQGEDGETLVESIPVISNVPIVVPGGGGYRATWPITASDVNGDTCWLCFSDFSMDAWLAGGGQEVNPVINHTRQLTDAIAIVSLRPFGNPWSSYPTDHATIGADSGKQIHMRDSTITIGEGNGDGIATKLDLQILFAAISNAPVSPSDGGATFKAAIIASLSTALWTSGVTDGKFCSGVALAER